jgi:hypothetical protein
LYVFEIFLHFLQRKETISILVAIAKKGDDVYTSPPGLRCAQAFEMRKALSLHPVFSHCKAGDETFTSSYMYLYIASRSCSKANHPGILQLIDHMILSVRTIGLFVVQAEALRFCNDAYLVAPPSIGVVFLVERVVPVPGFEDVMLADLVRKLRTVAP